ncbi:TPA: aminotransferase class III-fold pyridoxal phosphate-dependent enzyme [Klebsiella pneumoniae]
MQLNDMTLFRQQALIDGQWRDAPNGDVIAVTNPANGEQLGSVPKMGADETREAIEAANRALPAWRALTAKERANILRQGLLAIAEDHPEIGDVRGLGAMIAIELFEEGDRSRPNARLTADIVARARDKGLILLSCGPYYNVLRILVPLTIEEAQIEQGLKIIADCFSEAKQA